MRMQVRGLAKSRSSVLVHYNVSVVQAEPNGALTNRIAIHFPDLSSPGCMSTLAYLARYRCHVLLQVKSLPIMTDDDYWQG